MPDPIETYEASKILAKEGFVVLPYMPADPVLAKRLEDVGWRGGDAAGLGIGTGQGLTTVGHAAADYRGQRRARDCRRRAAGPIRSRVRHGDRVRCHPCKQRDCGSRRPIAMAAAFAAAVNAGYAARRRDSVAHHRRWPQAL